MHRHAILGHRATAVARGFRSRVRATGIGDYVDIDIVQPAAYRPSVRSNLLLLVALAIISGCGAEGADAPSVPPTSLTAASSAGPEPPASVPPPPATPAPAVRLDQPVVTVGDDERRLRVYVPDPEPVRPVPLLVFLHPFGGSPSEAARETGFDRLAGEEGFIAAFPPADGPGWAAAVTPGLSDSDVDETYLAGMLDELVATYPIDPERVHVAGFSVGAVMAGRLACRLADRIAGAALIAGNVWAGECDPARPVPILIVHGSGDATYSYEAAETLAEAWRERNGCSGAPTTAPAGNAATMDASETCDGGSSVVLVTVANGPHRWFREPDATRLAWDFFRRTARP